ncbi:Bacterial alpha-L-rhamnosidase [compost metagenome]
MKAINLKTEYLDSPMGIDIRSPRFFWNCTEGKSQTAYQIKLYNRNGVLWDTGKIPSSSMVAQYKGGLLESRDSLIWQVCLWDENDMQGPWSETVVFEMGLLKPEDFKAKWITGNYSPNKKKKYPVDCFCKHFTSRELVRARLYITACGLYEMKINGERVGDFIMAPGFTDYNKRIYYQTYDVTPLLKIGENVITAELADGWYRGSIGAMGIRSVYGKQTKLLAQLEMEYTDGTKEHIITDDSWQWSDDGPIRFADMKDGEIVDMSKKPSYSGQAKVTTHSITPTASNNVPVKEQKRFVATLSRTPAGKQLLDFGQNIAGYVEINIDARAGQTLYLQFAEHLDSKGELDMASIQCRAGKPNATPLQEIKIVCEDGSNHYKTKFAVFGFRYAIVESDISFKADHFTSVSVYSDMRQTGYFDCSNPLINQFVENTLWSMKGNFLDVPTDCPTRERAPWTGDVQIFCKTGTYFMDTAAFFRKWLYDLRDRQSSDGKVPCHAPDVRNNEFFAGIDFIKRMDGCSGWADTAVLVPWQLYRMYNDEAFLIDSYSSMKAHIQFQISRTNKTGLFGKPFPKPDKKYISNVGQGFGEWLEPKDVYKASVIQDFCAPHPEEATAYLSYVCSIMTQIAGLTNHPEDIALYEEYRTGCKEAYLRQFTPINTDRQSKLVRPLALGILDETEEKSRVFERLVSTIEKRNFHIGTGFLSTPLILPLLTKMGRTDIAYRMMENEEEPGWLYEVKQGATTVWENWDGTASQNHYSPGSVCEWLFETVCGVRISGDRHFTIAPQPGGSLTQASFSYDSIYGKVACSWKKTGREIEYEVVIPANTTADVLLPEGREEHSLDSGIYKFNS